MISVCMAVFNGERFLEEQLGSILIQLASDDEVIIVDDRSPDGSADLIRRIGDRRITLLQNDKNVGPAASFERAINLAKGKYIFLSDQDDIWNADKVATIRRVFESTECLVVVSDARVVDANGKPLLDSLFCLRNSRSGFWRNLYKNGFVGCCMALRSDAKAYLLPFPENVGMHDEWIGLCSSLAGHIEFIKDKLIDYRRHEANITQLGHGSIVSMVRKRWNFLIFVLPRLPRILSWRSRRRNSFRSDVNI